MQKIYRIDGMTENPNALATCHMASEMTCGALALLPTETVYGIGVAVSAFSGTGPKCASMPAPKSGYRRIFELKRRDLTQTVPWLVKDETALDVYAKDVDEQVRALVRAFWPGALTIVVKAAPSVPSFMQASDGTVALRASACPAVQALIRACNSPLAVTSANVHGLPAPTSFDEVDARILQGVDVGMDAGTTVCHDASTIVSLCQGTLEILRQGAISKERITQVLTSSDAQIRVSHPKIR